MLFAAVVSIFVFSHGVHSQYSPTKRFKCRPKLATTAIAPSYGAPPPVSTQPAPTTQAVVILSTTTTTTNKVDPTIISPTTTPPIVYGNYAPMMPIQPTSAALAPAPEPQVQAQELPTEELTPAPEPTVPVPDSAPQPDPPAPAPQPDPIPVDPAPQPPPAPVPQPAPPQPPAPKPDPVPIPPVESPQPPLPQPSHQPPPNQSNGIPDCNQIATITQNFQKTGDFAADAVNLSNQVRQYVGSVIGVTMPLITWNPQIAQGSAIHAQTSVNNGCGLKHDVSPTKFFPKSVGQNLYMQKDLVNGDPDTNIIVAIAAWVSPSECNAYNMRRVGVDTFEEWGHYSQVLYPSSTEIGCEVVGCSGGGFVTACDYSTPGNIGNSDTIKIGNGY
ncbi:UNVERIFIED_CONTAM: hypothetical protein HDU68_007442 [Siphonaria sp. JEL0065]|nr:hypothetical protein HDU68_007442 [Siphonaria sp. JEL0065]